MSFERSDGGIPRGPSRRLSTHENASREHDGAQANAARAEKLRRNSLARHARALNLDLRQSAYGYSLIDASRNRVDGRNDMTLDDVASSLLQLTG
jgi:hypothetical protein